MRKVRKKGHEKSSCQEKIKCSAMAVVLARRGEQPVLDEDKALGKPRVQ